MIESAWLSWLGDNAELWGLFGSGFISSTLLPGGSEIYLGYLVNGQQYSIALLIIVATVGNTLGGMVTWGMGYWLQHRFGSERLKKRHVQALRWLQRHGYPALLFSWLPIIGDPLCLISGWLKMRFWWCLLLIVSGKLLRYSVIAAGVSQF
ncbi:MAG: YqaA family protein [Motiliproteus sp.]